ncbi:MAG: biotin--[acetyl-CoA-carboxylase] ligase [Lentisphaeria bacterium]
MNPTTEAILQLLKNSSSYISGEEICKKLAISRTAVWKHINTLKNLGYDIDASSRKGYCLVALASQPLPQELRQYLHTEIIGSNIEYHLDVSSTNRLLMKRAEEDNNLHEGILIIAESQSHGHGRMQRPWQSPPNKNLYFSFLLKPKIPPHRGPQLAILSAIALHDSLKDLFPKLNLGIKWPNDLYIGNKKVAGILCEMQTDMTAIKHIVIGIGLNVNNTDFPPELDSIATSIKCETSQNENRTKILARILNRFEDYYKLWLTNGLKIFLPMLNKSSILLNKNVTMNSGVKQITGIVRGISENGNLLLENNGAIEEIYSGEVHSVRW